MKRFLRQAKKSRTRFLNTAILALNWLVAVLLIPSVLTSPLWAGSSLSLDPLNTVQCAGPNCTSATPVVADPAILGGERDVLVDQIAGTGSLRCWGPAWPGLAIDNDPDGARNTALIAWDGPDGDELAVDPVGLGGVDLLEGCGLDNRFLLNQAFADRSVRYELTIYSDADHVSRWSSGIVDPSAQLFEIGLTEFEPVAGGGANLSNVGAITLLIDASLEVATDVLVDSLTLGCEPTDVMLSSFDAESQGQTVLLAWETAAEIDNLGFHLYRAAKPGDGGLPDMERLTDALIPSQVPPGSPVGDTYEWLDEEVEPGLSYLYWLEAVDVYGLADMLEVVTVTVPNQYRIFLPEIQIDGQMGPSQ